jgi:hypothetical protein
MFITGCQAPQASGPVRICKSKGNIFEANAALAEHRAKIKGVRAGGNVLVQYYDNDNKLRKEKLGLTLRYYPPDLLYFRGDVLAQEVLRLGTNSDEFWVMSKPKEISSYHFGGMSDARNCPSYYWIDPQNLLDALGVVRGYASGALSGQEGFDVITKTLPGGVQKRLYIDRCDYLVRKIEYLGSYGEIKAVTQLDKYVQNGEESFIPSRIRMLDNDSRTTVEVRLGNVRLFEPTSRQLDGKLFRRPEPKGFEHVYRLGNQCRFEEQ